MKKLIFVLTLIFIFNSSIILAAGGELTPENKIKSDSFFYFLDRAGEGFHLFFKSGAEKAKLKFSYSYERLIEAGEMLEQNKTKEASELFKESVNNFSEGINIATKDTVNSEELQEVKKEVEQAISNFKKEMLKSKLNFDKLTNQLKSIFN
ncbi:hypothetical protein JCM16358_02540 [Halanaerocella petrolearia]